MTTQINIKIEEKLKNDVDLISSNIGLNTSDVIRIFLKKFVNTRGFPFQLIDDYNQETKQAMKKVKNGEDLIKVENISNLKQVLED